MLSVKLLGCFNSTLNNSQSHASAENNSKFKIRNSKFHIHQTPKSGNIDGVRSDVKMPLSVSPRLA